MRIAICSAFPQELRHIIRNFGALRSSGKGPFPFFLAVCAPHELVIVEAGMGVHNAVAALRFTLDVFNPGAVLFLGFGGALYPHATAGDLVWASSVMDFSGGSVTALKIPDPAGLAEKLSKEITMHKGAVVTLARRMEKRKIAEILPPDLPYAVCDMETYPAARFCTERAVPFFAVRAVTDTADEEIPDVLFTVSDATGKYKLSRALRLICTRPGLIPDIVRLWRTSDTSSANLYLFARSFIDVL
jgi:adenosylhomocysteine nucleosidase